MSDTRVTVSIDGRPLRTADLALIRSVDVNESMNSQTQVSVVVTCNVDDSSGWSSPLDTLISPFARFQVAIDRGGYSLVVPARATSAAWSLQPGALSTLTIAGLDASADLDRVEHDHDWGDANDAQVAQQLLGSFPRQDIGSTPPSNGSDRFTPHQRATDWAYLKTLATRNDFDVYVTSDDGRLTGHFNRIDPLAAPSTSLDLGYGDLGGTASVQVQLVAGQRVRLTHGVAGDGSQQVVENDGTGRAMGTRSLGGATTVLRDANDIPGTTTPETAARAMAEGSAFGADLSVTLTAPSMPLLRARRTVTVRGLGPLVSGLWLIKSVRHTVTPGGHTQAITLTRNALGDGSASGALAGALSAAAGLL
jgi:hypothetical protein